MERENFINELSISNKLSFLYKLLNKKNYDAIYNLYGREVYLFFTPHNYKKIDINKLLNEKKYGKILNKYGSLSKFYIRNFKTLKNNDIKNIEKKGNYQDIYERYGEKEYLKHIDKYKANDIYNETGNYGKYVLYKTKRVITKELSGIIRASMTVPVMISIFIGGVNIFNQTMVNENYKLYTTEIENYNDNIKNYAEQVNSLNLTDIQVIAKVLDDIWKDFYYGKPNYNIFGYERLDLSEGNVGVCRNLADDFTAKMNAINPKYNAKNIIVNEDSSYFTNDSIANINRNTSNEDYINKAPNKYFDLLFETVPNLTNEKGISIPFDLKHQDNMPINKINDIKIRINSSNDLSTYIGNHMMTMIDIPGENLSILIDSTNLSIGVLKDGKICMLSTVDNKGVDYSFLGEFHMCKLSDNFSYYHNALKSYFNNNSIENLEKKYGTDALNEALDYVRNLNVKKK